MTHDIILIMTQWLRSVRKKLQNICINSSSRKDTNFKSIYIMDLYTHTMRGILVEIGHNIRESLKFRIS